MTVVIAGTVRFFDGYNDGTNQIAERDAARAYVNALLMGDDIDSPVVDALAIDTPPGDVADAGGAQPRTAGRVEERPCGDGRRGSQTCQPSGVYGPCVCADAGSPMDVVVAADVVDVPAGRDVVDVVDVDPRQTPECRGVTQSCDGRTVDIQRGERDGGLTYHRGRCGVTCGAGFGCLTCVCIPL